MCFYILDLNLSATCVFNAERWDLERLGWLIIHTSTPFWQTQYMTTGRNHLLLFRVHLWFHSQCSSFTFIIMKHYRKYFFSLFKCFLMLFLFVFICNYWCLLIFCKFCDFIVLYTNHGRILSNWGQRVDLLLFYFKATVFFWQCRSRFLSAFFHSS